MLTPGSNRIYDRLFSTPEAMEALSDRRLLAEMLRFEQALSLSLEGCGVTPVGTAVLLKEITVDQVPIEEVREGAAASGNICIPFVKWLTRAVAERDAAASFYVHWGATSQDVLDTALLLQLRSALDLIQVDMRDACAALAERINVYRDILMAGRTWLQQGPPVTLGLKLAGWLDALHRHSDRQAEMRTRVFALQFGGAVGTLAPLGADGPEVAEELARELGLGLPAMPWHTHRDRMLELVSVLGMLAATLGKIGRDVSLLMQTEVGELFEPAEVGRGGSSTMPHKRNPVYSAVLLAAATRVPGLLSTMFFAAISEHERGLGGWQAEWETVTEIVRLCAGAIHALREMAAGFTVDAHTMERNLQITQGATMAEAVSFAIARRLGKPEAHRIVETANRRAHDGGGGLAQALAEEPSLDGILTPKEIADALLPENYKGSAAAFIDNVLAEHERRSKHALD